MVLCNLVLEHLALRLYVDVIRRTVIAALLHNDFLPNSHVHTTTSLQVLDSFPIGNPFQLLSLATSVGTPVVTLRPGTSFSTSKDALREMRTYITTQRAKHRALSNSNNNNRIMPILFYT